MSIYTLEPKIKNRFQTNHVTPKILSWLYFKCAISPKDRLKLFINKGFLTDVSGFTLEISKAEIIFSLPTVEIKLWASLIKISNNGELKGSLKTSSLFFL